MNRCKFFFFFLFSLTYLSFAEVYSFGSKLNPAKTEIVEQGNDLLITCTFKAQTKFDSAKNAAFNRKKADNYCQQGLLMYLGAEPGETVLLNGVVVEKSPEITDDEITYFFRRISVDGKPIVRKAASSTTSPPQIQFPNGDNSETNSTLTSSEVAPADSMSAVRSSAATMEGTLVVVRYTRENGKLHVVENKSFKSAVFKNVQEFDAFCEKMFEEVNQQAIENQEAVRETFQKEKNKILN